MKRFIYLIVLSLVTSMSFAQPRFGFDPVVNTGVENIQAAVDNSDALPPIKVMDGPSTVEFVEMIKNQADVTVPGFRPMGRIVRMTNTPAFRGWGGMFNFDEHGFAPVFNIQTPKLNQVRVYVSDIPAFEQRFSRKRTTVVTFEIPDSAGTTLLRFYGIDKTVEFLKTIKTVMEDISTKNKLSKKETDAYVKTIKKTMPQSAYFWDDYAGFNNKIEPIIIYNGKNTEPMIVLEGISYCRIKFKDLASIIDPEFVGDESISCEIQLPFNGVDEITRMIEQLNFAVNMPQLPAGFGVARFR